MTKLILPLVLVFAFASNVTYAKSKSGDKCFAFIEHVKKNKMKHKQALSYAKKIKMPEKEGYQCEEVIQKDKRLLKQLGVKIPRITKTNQKISKEAERLIKKRESKLFAQNKKVQLAIKKAIRNQKNKVSPNRGNTNCSPNIDLYIGEITLDSRFFIAGSCFGDEKGRGGVRLQADGYSNILNVGTWEDNYITVTTPSHFGGRGDGYQPMTSTRAILTVIDNMSRSTTYRNAEYRPKMKRIRSIFGRCNAQGFFFGAKKDCASLLSVSRKIQLLGLMKDYNYQHRSLGVSTYVIRGNDGHAEYINGAPITQNTVTGEIHVGCSGHCSVASTGYFELEGPER